MFMNLDQYNNYKVKVIRDLYNKTQPDAKDYLNKNFSEDDFADLIKEMEAEGLINNVRYVHGVEGAESVVPSFEHVAITDRGMTVLE